MPENPYLELCEGPIPELRLPRSIWNVLRRERIETLDQLKAVADHIERLERIGSWSAGIVREELARVTTRGGQPNHERGGLAGPIGAYPPG